MEEKKNLKFELIKMN